MKITLSLNRLAVLNNALYSIVGSNAKGNPRFMFAAKVNTDRMSDMMRTAEDRHEEIKTPGYRAFLAARDEIYATWRKKLEMKPNSFKFGESSHAVETEIIALVESPEYKEVTAQYTKDLAEVNLLFREEVTIELKSIDKAVLPKIMTMVDYMSISPIIEGSMDFAPHELTPVTLSTAEVIEMCQYLSGRQQQPDANGVTEEDPGLVPFNVGIARRLAYFVDVAGKPIYEEWMKVRKQHVSIPEFVAAQTRRNEIFGNEELSMEERVKQASAVMAALPVEVSDRLAQVDLEITQFGERQVTLDIPKLRLSDLPDSLSITFLDLFHDIVAE